MEDERIVPAELDPEDRMLREHLDRYLLASAVIKPDDVVVDAGCGVGYGSAMLGERAGSVIGLDISEEAIAYATDHFARDNVEFGVADVEIDAIPPCDVIVAFEFIEHIDNPAEFLKKAMDSSPRMILVSTPVVPTTHRNHFHLHDWDVAAVELMLDPWKPAYRCLQSGADRVVYGVWVFAPADQAAAISGTLTDRNLKDQQSEFMFHHQLLEEQAAWGEDLGAGKRWIEEAWQRSQGDVVALREEIARLEDGRAWLERQVDAWKAEATAQQELVQELQAWVSDLEAAKAWIEEQWKGPGSTDAELSLFTDPEATQGSAL